MMYYTSSTNYITKYERYLTSDLRGLAFTKWSGTDERTEKPQYYIPLCYRRQGIKNISTSYIARCSF